jgi:hypothetical protein
MGGKIQRRGAIIKGGHVLGGKSRLINVSATTEE